MSRLSSRFSSRLKPRDSVFTGGSELYRGDTQATCPQSLLDCVYAMEDCCEEVYEAEQLLRNGTHDLPRMSKVLDSQRVFLLVDESTVRRYQADLTDEIEPEINELIERASKGVKALSTKRSQLQTKVEAAKSRPPPRIVAGVSAASKMEVRRLNTLIRQRERLEEELTALEQEVEEMEAKS